MATKFVSVIPKMTSNTLPSPFVASASTQYSTEYQAWRAFNGESDDSQDSWIATVSTGWLQIKLDESKVVVMYDVVNVNSSGEAQKNAPKSWVLEGSVNGSSWVSLDKRTNEISWQAGEQRSFTFANGNSYLYYRINVTANNGRSYLGIAELVLYEEVEIITTDKILLSSGDGEIKSLKSAVPLDTSSIPVMTSNTAPNGIASASSQASTSYAPWNAFDKNVSSFWSSNADINPYLQYEFKEPVRIGAYALYSGNDTYKPKAWTFEGSNDGATWTVLDIQKSGYTINTLTRYTLSKWGMFKNIGLILFPLVWQFTLVNLKCMRF